MPSVARDCTLCVRSCVHMYIRVYVSICHLLVVYSDNNWWVLVAMSCDHTLVHWTCWTSEFSLVLHLQQEHCPYLNVSEFLVFPYLVSHYPIDSLPGSDFSISTMLLDLSSFTSQGFPVIKMSVVSSHYNHFPLSPTTCSVPHLSVSYITPTWLTKQFQSPSYTKHKRTLR